MKNYVTIITSIEIMKSAALDLGDKWVGIAISDMLGITCKPYDTVFIDYIGDRLKKMLKDEPVSVIVVGYPKTMSGTESDQTKKIVAHKEQLEAEFKADFPAVEWVLWDERMSSKFADTSQIGKKKDSSAKQKQHAIAAAFILQSYLDHQAFKRS